MARLCILVGATDASPTASLAPVYVGRDAESMRAALAASPFPVNYVVNNPPFIRKHNAQAAANAARRAPAAAADDAHALRAEVMRLQKENAELKSARKPGLFGRLTGKE